MNAEQALPPSFRRARRKLAAAGVTLFVTVAALAGVNRMALAGSTSLAKSPVEFHQEPLPPAQPDAASINAIESFEGNPLAYWERIPSSAGDPYTPYWQLVMNGSPYQKYHSPSRAMYFGSQMGDIGGPCPPYCSIRVGSLTYKGAPVSLVTTDTKAYLSFWSWEKTEMSIPGTECAGGITCAFDSRQVWISGTVDAFWKLKWNTQTNPTSEGNWHQVTVDISEYIGQSIRMRFVFHTIDDRNNDAPQPPHGWYVDDVRLFSFTPKAYVYMPILLKNR